MLRESNTPLQATRHLALAAFAKYAHEMLHISASTALGSLLAGITNDRRN